MNFVNKAVLTLVSLGFAASTDAAAREKVVVSQEQVAKEIRTLFKTQDEANWNGETPDQLARRFYTDDSIIIGEDATKAERGLKDAATALVNWNAYLGPGGNKGCKFEVKDPIVTSSNADMASVFATLTCKPNPPHTTKPEGIRQLFVLKRTSNGWRVMQEMWQMGGFQ